MARLNVAVLALVLALVPMAAFAQSGIAGDWELTLATPQGSNTVNVSLTRDGDKVAGTLTSPMGSVPFTGTAAGDEVKVVANIDVQGASIEMGLTAKVAGDALNGTVKFGDFGEFPFTGKRTAPKAGAAMSAAPSAAPPAARSAASSAAAPAASASAGGAVSGKWNIVLSVPGAGDFPMTATLTQAADKVTGMMSSAQAGDVAVTGTVSGTALKMEFTAQTPNGPIPVTMTGTLGASGVTGKADIAGMGEADWTGTRAQ